MTERIKLLRELTRGTNKGGPDLKLTDETDALEYIRFLRDRVFYLPANTPEELLWNDQEADSLCGGHLPANIRNETDFKKKIRLLSEVVVPYDEKHTLLRFSLGS